MFPDTYSQYDEEQAILGYFGPRGIQGSGRFLDIGAWHPKTFSNSRALFERGWGGVLVEPSPAAMTALLAEYGAEPRVLLVQGAIGLADTLAQFEMTDDCVSSSSAVHLARYKDPNNPNAAKFTGRAMVRTITWEQANNWWGGFNFVNIDAEGVSVDLFHAMLRSGAKPECCCVEFDDRLPELAAAASAAAVGYRMIYSNGTNAVFVL